MKVNTSMTYGYDMAILFTGLQNDTKAIIPTIDREVLTFSNHIMFWRLLKSTTLSVLHWD